MTLSLNLVIKKFSLLEFYNLEVLKAYNNCSIDSYWIYNKNHVDLSQVYLNPEEKLWYVIKHYQDKSSNKGFKLEKNTIVKFGRVRLRVRDIDYE